MHDIKTLKATPGLARRLLLMSQMNHMSFGDDLVELAMEGLLHPDQLKGFPYPIDAGQLSSLQFIRDWEGRGMILCQEATRGRSVALANAWLEGGSTLVMVQPKFYGLWAKLIRETFPEAKISVFGNPRYHEKGQEFPDGVEFSEKPDFEADVFISSYGALIWHNFFNHKTVNQTIVEELDNPGSLNYKWDDAVKGIFHEVPNPVFIQNINSLPIDHARDVFTSLQTNDSKPIQFIREQVTKLLWGGITTMGAFMYGHVKDAEDYLVGRGYTSMDNHKLLSLFGVSSHLLDDVQGHKKPIKFYDNTIKHLNQRRRQESGLSRFIEREMLIEEEAGVKLPAIVQDAIGGDRPSQALIGRLMVPQWASLKGQHLKQVHSNLANRTTRCLFLVNNQDLKRTLALQFGLQMADLSQVNDRQLTIGRYLYPMLHVQLSVDQWRSMRPLSNLIVTIDDMIAEPNLLNVTNFLFLGEPCLDRDYMEIITAAAAVSGTRLVTSVIRDTFEEEISEQLR